MRALPPSPPRPQLATADAAGLRSLLLKTSDDDGRTWSRPALVHTNSTEADPPNSWSTIGDALPLLDEHTGIVHLIFTRDNQDVFATSSARAARPGPMSGPADWAPPRNISSVAVKDRSHFVGTGHAAGLQLGDKAGTMLVPMYGGGSNSFVLASEDRGASWAIRSQLDAPPNEWVMTKLAAHDDRRLFASLRSSTHHRLQSWSQDGARSWEPTKPAALPEPLSGCEGSALLHPNGLLYYAHPSEPLFRNMMDIKVSRTGGRTWEQHARIWGPGAGCEPPCVPAASYSSMAVLGEAQDSAVGLFYMRKCVLAPLASLPAVATF